MWLCMHLKSECGTENVRVLMHTFKILGHPPLCTVCPCAVYSKTELKSMLPVLPAITPRGGGGHRGPKNLVIHVHQQ